MNLRMARSSCHSNSARGRVKNGSGTCSTCESRRPSCAAAVNTRQVYPSLAKYFAKPERPVATDGVLRRIMVGKHNDQVLGHSLFSACAEIRVLSIGMAWCSVPKKWRVALRRSACS